MTTPARTDRRRPWSALRIASAVGSILGICFAWGVPSAQAIEPLAPDPIQQLFRKYCWECHDHDTAKARLSLEDTPALFTDHALQDRWTRVFDRISRAEMPPPDSAQPSIGERQALLSWLKGNLQQASRDDQLREGRAPLRRLSRNEYANAMNDLFGIRVELLDVLPEDTRVAGFDKLSRGIDISAQHWVRYQQAAQRVMDAALPDRPPVRQHTRMTGRQWFEQQRRIGGKLAELVLRPAARIQGDSVTLYAQSTFHSHLQVVAGSPQEPGRYRLRASLRARGNGGQPLPVLVFLTGYIPAEDPTLQRVIEVKDIPETAPRLIDLEIEVPHFSERWKTQSVALAGWSLPQQPQPGALEAQAALNQPLDFSGPGLTLDWVEFEGPLDPFPTTGYQRFLGDLPTKPTPADVDRLVERLANEILRRPLLPPDALAIYRQYASQRLAQGDGLALAMKATCQAMLSSPYFLFRQETPGRLDGAAIASRLAAFLWNSVPDPVLRDRARSGQLTEPDPLRAEVERMLNDPRSSRLTEDLALQWLDLRNLNATTPDLMYDEFDAALLWSMPRETYGFLQTLLHENRSIDELVRSDWTHLNERLAQHYGINGVAGWELRKTSLPPGSHRGGVITHASILKVTANGTSTSPVLRGKWILDRILGQPPSPPPPDTPAIEPDIRGASTIREQLEKHRQVTSCARCHRWIDPPGFALETYDVIGGWREWYRIKSELNGRASVPNYPHIKVWKGPAVEQGYRTATGKAFANIDDYRALLLQDRDQIARCLIQKLVSYATGAEPQFADREVIEDILQRTRGNDFRFRDLIHAVVQSRMFLEK